tara:strand:+ start:22 stop:1227 length:1206 start_codon:yes stop_codon:yes gene_type:complete
MSYNNIEDIRVLLEDVSEIEDTEGTNIVESIYYSMLSEGYSSGAIEGYLKSATQTELIEKYFSLPDEILINENYENLLLEKKGLIQGIGKGLRDIGKKFGKNFKKKWNNPDWKGGKEGLKKVKTTKTNKTTKNSITDPWLDGADKYKKSDAFPITGSGSSKKSISDKLGTLGKNIKTKSSKVVDKSKNFVKNNPIKSAVIGGGAAGAVSAIGTNAVLSGGKKKKEAEKQAQYDAEKSAQKATNVALQSKIDQLSKDFQASQQRLAAKNAGEQAAKAAAQAKKDQRESDKKSYLHKIRNSPAVKSGAFSGEDLYKQHLKHKQWQKDNNRGEFRKNKKSGGRKWNPSNRVTQVMDLESYEPYDIVLDYLLETNQVTTIEEANYVMLEMDSKTIQGIVEDFNKE